MLNAIGETILKPWREPMTLPQLAMWVAIAAIVAWIVFDSLRVLSSWMVHHAPTVVE